MIRHSLKTLSTTVPTEVTIEDSVNGVCTLVVQNVDLTSNVYLGNSDVSTSNYGFIWGMAGENLRYDDMDSTPVNEIK